MRTYRVWGLNHHRVWGLNHHRVWTNLQTFVSPSPTWHSSFCSDAKEPNACQAMDDAGRLLQLDEVDGSLCATVAGCWWKCSFKTWLRFLYFHTSHFFFGVSWMYSCKVRNLFLLHPQVASARPRGIIERPQFTGSSIDALLFGTFFHVVLQRKNLKGIFVFFI